MRSLARLLLLRVPPSQHPACPHLYLQPLWAPILYLVCVRHRSQGLLVPEFPH